MRRRETATLKAPCGTGRLRRRTLENFDAMPVLHDPPQLVRLVVGELQAEQ
jgi:hypothetical protein